MVKEEGRDGDKSFAKKRKMQDTKILGRGGADDYNYYYYKEGEEKEEEEVKGKVV